MSLAHPNERALLVIALGSLLTLMALGPHYAAEVMTVLAGALLLALLIHEARTGFLHRGGRHR